MTHHLVLSLLVLLVCWWSRFFPKFQPPEAAPGLRAWRQTRRRGLDSDTGSGTGRTERPDGPAGPCSGGPRPRPRRRGGSDATGPGPITPNHHVITIIND